VTSRNLWPFVHPLRLVNQFLVLPDFVWGIVRVERVMRAFSA
jgi:hypothetical protein